ncbi:TonB-dependent receptor [Sphingobacterium olei]|uniref:TonB-dependent receptor n=1 Tax=Sphingobacterium olei TaxID=2571155 RepID=A0A4U0NKF8_9SPHI|nr:TonB-dependent receptor [Sphingobacterium olei]TJZ54767.1 TonB-dependent receptor [Sphingobacterium olei]
MKKNAICVTGFYCPRLFKTLILVKLTFILTVLLHVTAIGSTWAQNERATLNVRSAKLGKILKEIENQTKYRFVYGEALLTGITKPFAVHANDTPVKDILTDLLINTDLNFELRNDYLIILSKELKTPATGQATLRGAISDNHGKRLAGVTVKIAGNTNKVIISDQNGSFQLASVNIGSILQISSIGYLSQEIMVSATHLSDGIHIVLESEISALEETVVIGYGSAKRKDLTGSIASINPDEIRDVPFMSIDAAMVGKAPGVQITKSDGSPGGAVRIRIRGGASLIGSNDPLYIIDGVPVLVENKYVGVTDMTNPVENYGGENARNSSISGSFSRGLNNLAGLNIDDIESIDILKDASATAIYGSKAANGVVIINTKKGKKDQKPILEANYYSGFSRPLREKVLNASQYKEIMLEAATTRVTEDIRLGRTPNALANALVNNPMLLGDGTVDTDWLSLVLRRGHTQNGNLSVRGGGSASRHYSSLAYTKQEGALRGTDFSRIAGKLSLDNDISSKLKVVTNLDYGFTTNNITNGVYSNAMMAPPIFTPYNADGTFVNFDQQFAAATPVGGGSDFGIQNPLAMASAINNGKNSSLLGSLSLEYDILNDLKFRSTASVNYGNYRQRNYIPSYLEIANPNSQGGQSSQGGVGSQSNSTTVNSFFENTLTWDKEINENHRLNLLGGTSWEKYATEFFSAEGRGYPNDDFLNNLSSAIVPAQVQGANPSGEYALLSFYMRANYAFKDRYLFTFTGRNDISSKFPKGKQATYFPSGALAWRLSEENFLKGVSWMDDLKLRVSAGYTGSQSIGNYLFLSLYSPVAYAGASAFTPTQLGNRDIKWERTLQKDLGLDFSFFKTRLRGTLGYYEKNTSGLLLNMTPPPSYAFSSVIMNVASIANRGLEFDVRGDIIRNKTFNWNLAFNISRNISKVTSIQGGDFSNPNNRNALNLGTSIVREGEELGLLYGRVATQIAQSSEEATQFLNDVYFAQLFNPFFNAGDMMYEKSLLTSSGGVDYYQYKYDVIGNINPDFYGGITNIFSYKNIHLNTLFTYSYGNDILFQTDVRDRGINNLTNKGERILGRWTPTNPNSERERLIFGQSAFLNNNSVYDASYLKLKSLTVGYDLPKITSDKLGVRYASFYVSATNLFVITNYPGLDPEISDDPRSVIGGGRDLSSYPTTRELTIGIRLGF